MRKGDLLIKGGLTAMQELNENFDNVDEAFLLLGIIAAEFQSDPMSVQCFDARIVERVRVCVGKRIAFVRNNPTASGRKA